MPVATESYGWQNAGAATPQKGEPGEHGNAPGFLIAAFSQWDSAMYRIIHGALYERHASPYAHDLRVHDLGHGQTEAVVSPRYGWSEVTPPTDPIALADYEAMVASYAPEQPSARDREQLDALNRERATRRARTKMRRLIKVKGLTTMLTLTYRENMVDRDRMARDLDVFLKRVRRVIPGFQYVAVFERQKRGAWHAHLAVEKVLSHYVSGKRLVRSYDLLRSMWRAVVGVDNGNVDVSRNRRVQRSLAKLASYMSKYIGKTLDQRDKYVNSYSASGRALPRPISIRLSFPRLGDALAEACGLLEAEIAAGELFMQLCDGGGAFICLSPPEATCSRRRSKQPVH